MSNLDIKFKRLTPFKRCVLQNFPFIEEDFDALTNYGLLCKVVAYLNKVIESQNEVQGVTEEIVTSFNNLYDYVEDYFDNLDVQDEIDNKLDQMAEDGTLESILQKIITQDDYANFHTLFATPYYRSSDEGVGMQGGCVLPDGTIIQATGHDKVQHWSSTGTLLNEVTLAIGHANGCCYNSKLNKVLFTSTQSDTIGKYKVFIVDPTTLALENTIDCADKDFPATPYGFIYLEDEDEYVFTNYWQPGYSKYIWKTDADFNVTTTEEYTFDLSASANIGKFGDYIGIADLTSNKILLFNKDLTFFKEVDINPLVSDTWFITEIEWFDTLGDKIYLGFIPQAATNPSWGTGAKVYAVFDPEMNYRETKRGTETTIMPYTERYYVSSNSNPLRDGSQSAPFANIYEALNSSLRTENTTGVVEIHLMDNVENTYVPYFSMNKTYRIFANYEGADLIKSFSAIVINASSKVEIRKGVLLTGNSPVSVISNIPAHIQINGELYVNGDVYTSETAQLILTGGMMAKCEFGVTTSGIDLTNYTGEVKSIRLTNINVNNIIMPAYNSTTQNTRSLKGVITNELTAVDSVYTIPFLSSSVKLRIRFNIGNLQNERTFEYVFGQYNRYSFLTESNTVEKITMQSAGTIEFTSGITNIRVIVIS